MKPFCATCLAYELDATDLMHNEDDYLECRRCRLEPVRERPAPEYSYEGNVAVTHLRGAIAASYKKLKASGAVKAAKPFGPGRSVHVTAGWIPVRVRVQNSERTLDAQEALDSIADEPWAHETRYLGVSRDYHVFERPGPDVTPASENRGRAPANMSADPTRARRR